MKTENLIANAWRGRESKRKCNKEVCAAINNLQAVLLTCYGHDFAYTILGNGFILAASNKKNGIVTPSAFP